MGNATGLFNMLRNIGGSIGIAMATTALIRRAALHQTEIGANLSPSSWSMVCSRSPPCHRRAISAIASARRRRAPAPFGLIYGLDGAAIRPAGLCRCLPLDRACWPSSAPRRLALQKAEPPRIKTKTPVESEIIWEGMASYGNYNLFAIEDMTKLYTSGIEYDRHSWGYFLRAQMDYVAEVLPFCSSG
jgi:hypothetical protein